MKTIVISDLHLTDKFETDKFLFLQNLISSCDQLIINGDLWCGLSTTFEKFLNSPWKQLFPLMLAKNTIYIHGNHDLMPFIDHRYQLFAKSLADHVAIKNQDNSFIVTHGHKFFKYTNPQHLNLNKIYRKQRRRNSYYSQINKLIAKAFDIKAIRKIFVPYNRLILKKARQFFAQNSVYIFGHSHVPEFRPDKGYVNTGYIMAGLAWYLEINDTSFHLLSAKY